MLDILNLLPHEVSRNLIGYILMFYGAPKSGKTTVATQFPKSLLIAFEFGFNALPGIKVIPMVRWSPFKEVIMQLDTPESKAMYDYIIIDTGDLAYKAAEEFIFNKYGATEYSDIPYGKGYTYVEEEFDKTLRKIVQMGYGLIFISHDQEKTIKDQSGEEYTKIMPTLDKRARKVINRMCDIIGYTRIVEDPDSGKENTYLFMRGSSRFEAGSRFKYTSDYIIFTYENLVNDINNAIDKLGTKDKATLVDDQENNYEEKQIYNIEEELNLFYELANKLINKDIDYQEKITEIIEEELGINKNIKNCTEKQADIVHLITERISKL